MSERSGTDGPAGGRPADDSRDPSRDQEAVRRDAAAYRRDRAADQRDHSAAIRDDAATERDAAAERDQPPLGSAVTEATRDQSAAVRQGAATDRSRARGDREAGARGRMDSERDRVSAQLDRGVSDRGRKDVDIDVLTGAYRREPGLAALDHDISRARRRGDAFVVARISVGELAVVDGNRGQAAGDRLLVEVASALRAASTGDQVLVRLGDDEFVYGLPGLSLDAARQRVTAATASTAVGGAGAGVTTDLAGLRAGESTGELLARAGVVGSVRPV